MKRTLRLRKETLTELTQGQLQAMVGGSAETTTTGTALVTTATKVIETLSWDRTCRSCATCVTCVSCTI